MHLTSVPTILLVVGALVVVLALTYLLREFLVSRHRGSFECSLWRRAMTGRSTWQSGLMRYGTQRLRWFRAFSLAMRPELVIRREEILEIERETVTTNVDGDEQQMLIRMHLADGTTHRMLMGASAASGLLAWQEAAPAGSLVFGVD